MKLLGFFHTEKPKKKFSEQPNNQKPKTKKLNKSHFQGFVNSQYFFMKFSWKNVENWRSWKMRFFWGGHFEFSKSAILNFFLLHLCEKSSPFIWGVIFFCTMDGFSRILEKKLSELLCTRLYQWKNEYKILDGWIFGYTKGLRRNCISL